MAAYRDFPNAREDMLEGRFVMGYLLQFHAVKKVYAGAEVEQSADEGTGDERIFAIPEVIDDLLDEFRWDTKLHCVLVYFWMLPSAARTEYFVVSSTEPSMLRKGGFENNTDILFMQ